MKFLSTISLVLAVSGLMIGCQTLGKSNEGTCLPGSACYKKLPVDQQANRRVAWVADRQYMLNQQDTTHNSKGLWSLNPISGY